MVQGLGKTISTIALILSSRRRRGRRRSSKQLSASAASTDGATSADASESASMQLAGTLVVCPASVGLQWVAELADKVCHHAGLHYVILQVLTIQSTKVPYPDVALD